jgi:hypothetical protein
MNDKSIALIYSRQHVIEDKKQNSEMKITSSCSFLAVVDHPLPAPFSERLISSSLHHLRLSWKLQPSSWEPFWLLLVHLSIFSLQIRQLISLALDLLS